MALAIAKTEIIEEYKFDDKELNALDEIFKNSSFCNNISSNKFKQTISSDPMQYQEDTNTCQPTAQSGNDSFINTPTSLTDYNRSILVARLLEEAAKTPAPTIPLRRPHSTLTRNLRHLSIGPTTRCHSEKVRTFNANQNSADSTSLVSPQSHSPLSMPLWIRNVFQAAKDGNLTELKSLIEPIDLAVVRSLKDCHGNVLTHILCACGHVMCMHWLLTFCGREAINSTVLLTNRFGISPLFAAIRCGQISIIQWLLANTLARDVIFGDLESRSSILYAAVTHKQVQFLQWYIAQLRAYDHASIEELMLRSIDASVDGTKITSQTSQDSLLHVAARVGSISICQLLLTHGACLTAKNNAGLTARDISKQNGHTECAEFLAIHDILHELAIDFVSIQAETARTQTDNCRLRDCFREMLSVSKRLVKDRDEHFEQLKRLDKSLGILADQISLRKDFTDQDRISEHMDLCQGLVKRTRESINEHMSVFLTDSLSPSATSDRVRKCEGVWKRLRSRARNFSETACADSHQAGVLIRSKMADLTTIDCTLSHESRSGNFSTTPAYNSNFELHLGQTVLQSSSTCNSISSTPSHSIVSSDNYSQTRQAEISSNTCNLHASPSLKAVPPANITSYDHMSSNNCDSSQISVLCPRVIEVVEPVADVTRNPVDLIEIERKRQLSFMRNCVRQQTQQSSANSGHKSCSESILSWRGTCSVDRATGNPDRIGRRSRLSQFDLVQTTGVHSSCILSYSSAISDPRFNTSARLCHVRTNSTISSPGGLISKPFSFKNEDGISPCDKNGRTHEDINEQFGQFYDPVSLNSVRQDIHKMSLVHSSTTKSQSLITTNSSNVCNLTFSTDGLTLPSSDSKQTIDSSLVIQHCTNFNNLIDSASSDKLSCYVTDSSRYRSTQTCEAGDTIMHTSTPTHCSYSPSLSHCDHACPPVVPWYDIVDEDSICFSDHSQIRGTADCSPNKPNISPTMSNNVSQTAICQMSECMHNSPSFHASNSSKVIFEEWRV